jgi:hypothetical protein
MARCGSPLRGYAAWELVADPAVDRRLDSHAGVWAKISFQSVVEGDEEGNVGVLFDFRNYAAVVRAFLSFM